MTSDDGMEAHFSCFTYFSSSIVPVEDIQIALEYVIINLPAGQSPAKKVIHPAKQQEATGTYSIGTYWCGMHALMHPYHSTLLRTLPMFFLMA
jgi:hypothetical protein